MSDDLTSLRMREQRWQRMMEPHLAGKLFRQEVEAQIKHCKHVTGYVSTACWASTTDKTIYKQDEALPHFANIARVFLDEQFTAIWIGRGSPPYITWPARSPEQTPPDFFFPVGIC